MIEDPASSSDARATGVYVSDELLADNEQKMTKLQANFFYNALAIAPM
jgi:hypothetical protein